MNEKVLWPIPRQRNIGTFSDTLLYVDALEQAQDVHGITTLHLQHVLGPRLRSRRLVEQVGLSSLRGLLEELRLFDWMDRRAISHGDEGPVYSITANGAEALKTAQTAPREFLRLLAARLQAVYTIPGWFVARLWSINPQHGEVILPSPAAGWAPSAKTRATGIWTSELEQETLLAARRAGTVNQAAFPVADDRWLKAVSEAWHHVRDRKRTKSAAGPTDTMLWSRGGLLLAMRMAVLRLLFDRVPYSGAEADFASERPLTVKTLKPWCPRLQTLALIAYTDWHPAVTGRLLFPTSVFRADVPSDQFEELPGICHPDGRRLFLYQPAWSAVRDRFWAILADAYRGVNQRVQARYVSLLDVRDEVCRRLRLSPAHFDGCFAQALEEPVCSGTWQLSIETDIREDDRSGGRLARRPVYVGKIPYTLLALTQLPGPQRRAV